MMTKEQSVVDFYAKIQKLNDAVRTGWLDWGAHRERLERYTSLAKLQLVTICRAKLVSQTKRT